MTGFGVNKNILSHSLITGQCLVIQLSCPRKVTTSSCMVFHLQDDATCCCGCRVFLSTLAHLGFFIGIIWVFYGYFEPSAEWLYACSIAAGVCYGVLWLELWCSHDLQVCIKVKVYQYKIESMTVLRGIAY